MFFASLCLREQAVLTRSTARRPTTDGTMEVTTLEAVPLPPTAFPTRVKKPGSTRVTAQVAQRKVALDIITPNNIGQVKALNSVIFPVAYGERFYTEAIRPEKKQINKIGEF